MGTALKQTNPFNFALPRRGTVSPKRWLFEPAQTLAFMQVLMLHWGRVEGIKEPLAVPTPSRGSFILLTNMI